MNNILSAYSNVTARVDPLLSHLDLAVEAAKALTKDDLVKIVKLRNCIIGWRSQSSTL